MRMLTASCCTTAVLLAGCGGDDPKPLSKAEYVKQADVICTDTKAKQAKLGQPSSAKDIVALTDKTKPIIQDEIKRLRALQAPDELKDTASDAYALLDKQLPLLDRLNAAAKANDVKKLQSIVQGASGLSAQATGKAKALGLKVCGQNS